MYQILIHKDLIPKVDYLYFVSRKYMYVDKTNIQRDIAQCHYRFNKWDNIVVLLGYNIYPFKRENFINIEDAKLKVKENKW